MNNPSSSNELQELDSSRAETAETAKTPQHVRILLSEAASKALLDAGECWMIAGKSSHPEQPGRVVLHLLPIPKPLADAACEVAQGKRKPGRKS